MSRARVIPGMLMPAILAAAATAPDRPAPAPDLPPSLGGLHRRSLPRRAPRLGGKRRWRLWSLAKQLKWDREALGLKSLPKDLHPHVAKRELLHRQYDSPLKGTGRVFS